MGWRKISIQWIFHKIYHEDSIIRCFMEADVKYSDNLHNHHNDLLFLSARLKTVKIEKIVAKLHDQEKYKRTLKQALNYGSGLRNCIN